MEHWEEEMSEAGKDGGWGGAAAQPGQAQANSGHPASGAKSLMGCGGGVSPLPVTCLTSEMEKLGDPSRTKSMGPDTRGAMFESQLFTLPATLGKSPCSHL